MVPCVVFEDDEILVVNKPPGLNTHSAAPYTGEGIYDWLRHREPRWQSLSILHRLDKDTSGILLFGKTRLANRSLTAQFEKRKIIKRYVFLTDRPCPQTPIFLRTPIVREGCRFVCKGDGVHGQIAETRFRLRGTFESYNVVEAEPLTGRTHQVRTHAAHAGFPVLGDTLYGGTPAWRLCLHSELLVFYHPKTCKKLSFTSEADWKARPSIALRTALIDPSQTDVFRVIHGAADGWPGWFVDKLGDYLFSQKASPLAGEELAMIETLVAQFSCLGVYHQVTDRHHGTPDVRSNVILLKGQPPDNGEIRVRENGVRYLLKLGKGSSVGLFLDQRDNRRRILVNHVGANFPLFENPPAEIRVLNLFAHTCGFSVCAAMARGRTTNVDLSKTYLEWARSNFVLNNLRPDEHEFLRGDAMDWVRRLRKKGRKFDLVIVDPPTFSTSKERGVFRVEKDLTSLVGECVPLVAEGGVLFVSCNAAGYDPARFVNDVLCAVELGGARPTSSHYAPQPPDFPTTKAQPAHLKSIWLRLSTQG
ncbi:MAG: pseudouridine synthase [Verrucomicrobiae bacterium]|nr:pseudouridine synthase [Verrucomicrobiae bacterium]